MSLNKLLSGIDVKTIAISANTSWYLYNFRKNTITALIELGYQVIAIAPHDTYATKLEELGARFIHVDIDQSGTNPIKDIKTLYSLIKAFYKHRVDIVLNFTPKNNIYGTLAAKISGTKSINNIAGLGTLFVNETLTSKIARMLYKVSQCYAHKIFFQNEDDRALFINSGIVRAEFTDRLPGSGADLTRFSITPAIDDGVTRFLLIARMLYEKGINHYVEAARILKKKYGLRVEFSLLGFLDVNNPSAVSKAEMQAWVGEGIINYLGTTDTVENEIAKADCMVLPSFYREGVPKSLLEAGAMGKPIVTTNNIGCKETVDDGVNGFLCEPRNTLSLVDALEKMIVMGHAQRLTMGNNSRKKMENEFDEKIVIDRYIDAVLKI